MQNGIFDRVVVYDCSDLYTCTDDEELKTRISEKFQNISVELGVNFQETINYSTSDVDDAYSIFMKLSGAPLKILTAPPTLYENTHLRYESLYSQKLVSKSFYELQKCTGALQGDPSGSIVIASPKYRGPCAERFEFGDYPAHLSKEQKKCVYNSFKIRKLPGKKTTLILTNSINFMKGAGIKSDDLPFMYKMLVDYFLSRKEKYLIKPHPFSPDYKVCFKEKNILDNSVNIDILNYKTDAKIKKIISVNTSSSTKIAHLTKENIVLNSSFANNYQECGIFLGLIRTFSEHKEYNIHQDFIDDEQFLQILSHSHGCRMPFSPIANLRNESECILLTKDMNHIQNFSTETRLSIILIMNKNEENKSITNYSQKIEYIEPSCKNHRIDLYIFSNNMELLKILGKREIFKNH